MTMSAFFCCLKLYQSSLSSQSNCSGLWDHFSQFSKYSLVNFIRSSQFKNIQLLKVELNLYFSFLIPGSYPSVVDANCVRHLITATVSSEDWKKKKAHSTLWLPVHHWALMYSGTNKMFWWSPLCLVVE